MVAGKKRETLNYLSFELFNHAVLSCWILKQRNLLSSEKVGPSSLAPSMCASASEYQAP